MHRAYVLRPPLVAAVAALAALGALALGPAPVGAAEGGSPRPAFAPRPEWVLPLEPPDTAPAPSTELPGGVDYLLLDDQILLGSDGPEHWARRVRRVASLQGIDSESQFQIDWDPAYERLTIHRVVVRRDGVEMERLVPDAIEVLRREPDFEASLLDGTVSALVVVSDVRPGDVIEHEFTISGANPAFGGRWFGGFSASWGVPVRRLGYRIRFPAGRDIRWLASGLDASPSVTEDAGSRDLAWVLEDLPPFELEGDAPGWHDPGGSVALSEFPSWAEVARWAVPLFAAPGADAGDGEIARLVARLESEGATPEARALAAIRFVQDDVRYLGLEMGPGSHRPSPPDLVLERRFGDCKDKALLLVTLLRGLGIAADPALVSTLAGPDLDAALPSPAPFDHVIVRLELDGRVFWVDPTIAAQGGPLAARHVPRFGRALIVREDSTGLAPIVPAAGDSPATEVVARFVLPEVGGLATLTVRTTYRGRDADETRAGLGGESRQQTERGYLDYYARLYPSLRTARPLVIRDDEAANVLVTDESYAIPEAWTLDEDGSAWRAVFHVPEIEGLLVEPERIERESPLAIDHPRNVVHETILELPEAWDVGEEDEEVEGPAATFRRSVEVEDRRIVIRHEWRTIVDSIPAGEVPRHAAMIRRAFDLTGYELTVTDGERPIATGSRARGPAVVPATPQDGMNWSVLALALMTTLAGGAAALALVLWRAPTPVDAPAPLHEGGVGVVLLAAASALLPVGLGVSLARSLAPFGLATWHALTTPSAAASAGTYEPLAAPLLLLSLIGGVLVFMVSVVLLPLLVLQRRSFRVAFPSVILAGLALEVARAAASTSLPLAFPNALGGVPLACVGVAGLALAAYAVTAARLKLALTA